MQTVEKELDSNSQCLDVRNGDLLLELRKEGLLYPKFHFLPAILESLHPVWTSAHVLMKLWFPSWLLELRGNAGKGLLVQNANPARGE